MEGICAIISFHQPVADIQNKIQAMAQALSDGEGLNISTQSDTNWALASGAWQEDHWPQIAFVHREEDLAVAGVAEVYNLDELAEKYRVRNKTLGHVISMLYRREQRDWPLQIRGTCAVIILDLKENRFLAVTDRIGIRPLHWYRRNNVYYLSSRIRPIRRLNKDLQVDPNAIYAYIHHHMIPSPLTIYKDVQKLEPGYFLEADGKSHKLKRYWDITTEPKIDASEKEIAEKVYQTIDRAVALMRQDITDEKQMACFLSGGTDSSSICGLLSKRNQNPVAAYSIGFPENGYDEMFYARAAAKVYGLNHIEYYMQPDDVLNPLQNVAAVYDEPFNNSSVFPAYILARKAKENGVNFLLAGDGGDEIFAGNERYGAQQVFQNYFRIPAILRNLFLEPLLLGRLEKLPLGLFRKAGSYIRRAKLPELERLLSYRYFNDDQIFTEEFVSICDPLSTMQIAARHYNALNGASSLDKHLYLDMKHTITDNDLRKVTRMCELAHMRVRYPMLDYPVVELGFQIPTELKLRGTSGLRYIFKRAFRELLPQDILTKSKWGFGLPISQWLRNDLRIKTYAYELLFDPRHLQRGYFQPDFIQKLWQLQLNDKTPYYGTLVWQLIMLEEWHRRHPAGEI